MKTFATKSLIRNHAYFAKSAGEVMTRNPLSVNETATIGDIAAFLTAKSISAAPVIDEAGRPVGVLSLADIVRYAQGGGSSPARRLNAPVSEIMNDVVFFVRPDTPIGNVIDDLLTSDVKRLFVIDENEVLVGVISTRDLLRRLRLDAPASNRASPRRPPYRRRPALHKRSARIATTTRSGSDIVLAGLYG
jgi:CBS domain-containing protein